jgi:hypothetical protein
MDGKRIDKVLVSPLEKEARPPVAS